MFEILATDCDPYSAILKFIKSGVFPVIQFGIPILIIILGSIDLGKAVIGGDEKKTKEATTTLVKRFAFGVAIFFVPIVVDLVFGMFANTGGGGTTGTDDLVDSTLVTCWDQY